jgi:pectate lyase
LSLTLLAGLVSGILASPTRADTSNAWDSTRGYAANDLVNYAGRQWRAATAVPAGMAPAGVGDGSADDRAALLSQRVGFGRQAGTAGINLENPAIAPTYHVTTDADDYANPQPGSLRYALAQPVPLWIVFDGDLTIKLNPPDKRTMTLVTSNKVIDGRGHTVVLQGRDLDPANPKDAGVFGLGLDHVANVIIENLTLTKFGNPALTSANNIPNALDISASHDVWVDHTDLSHTGNKVIGVSRGSSNLTVSWNHVHDQAQGIEIGNQATGDQDTVQTVTLHHNYFEPGSGLNSGYRHPVVSYGSKAHAYNNYDYHWTAFGMLAQRFGQLYAENNILEAGSNRSAVIFQPQTDGANDHCGKGVSIDLNTPINGSTVTDTVTVHASVRARPTTAGGTVPVIDGVQFFLDGSPFGSPISARPFELTWDTATSGAGTHTLEAKALYHVPPDSTPATASSTTVTGLVSVVVADRAAPPPPGPDDTGCNIDDRPGFVKAVGNLAIGTKVKVNQNQPGTVFHDIDPTQPDRAVAPSELYPYVAEAATLDLAAKVKTYAGPSASPWVLATAG